MEESLRNEIDGLVKNNKVFLFMKGTPDNPQCGFSAQVIQVLKKHEVEFKTCDILEREDIREGVKEYSDWPTIPQLFIDGKFIGGCDITMEMDQSGELAKLLS